MGNSDFQRMVLTETVLPKEPEEIFKQIENFKELMLTYNSAIREVTTKLEILNDELSLDDGKNPIQFIKSRVKKPLSIVDKLQRLGKE